MLTFFLCLLYNSLLVVVVVAHIKEAPERAEPRILGQRTPALARLLHALARRPVQPRRLRVPLNLLQHRGHFARQGARSSAV